ncbi:MAG: GIY-YIG nuclease family protein [Nitrospiraceae bacterium]|nr:GIY-YIG nuclease family protein [Nitrospiraceae bacterium]
MVFLGDFPGAWRSRLVRLFFHKHTTFIVFKKTHMRIRYPLEKHAQLVENKPITMQKPSKESIIEAYNDLVKKQGGKPVGERFFKRETGLSHHYWKGGYWRSWSAFQADAGYEPNSPNLKIPDETVLRHFAELALERNEIPIEADLMLKRKEDSSFPGKLAFRRWGSRDALFAKVAEYCEEKEQFAPVLDLLKSGISNSLDHRLDSFHIKGFVYLLRSGKNYKLGRSNAVGRRLRELSIQLPQKPDMVHVIETDDPEGIEQYWHRRFAEKRQGGEWFVLSPEDVRAFKKRRFQ